MKVLVPIDGSNHSHMAVEMLGKAQWVKPDEVILLNVVPSIGSFLPFHGYADEILREQEIVSKRAKSMAPLVDHLKANFPQSPNIHSRIKFGNPKEVILNTIAKENIDLVVMGSHGRSGIEKLILGSVSQAVLEMAPSAVLLAKYSDIDNYQGISDFSRILVPYDGSVYSRDLVNWICQRQWPEGTQFRLAMAIEDFENSIDLDFAEEHIELVKEQWLDIKQRAFDILEEVALKIGEIAGNENVSLDAISGPPREVIWKEICKFKADCVAVGSHGRSGLDKIMLGSISLHVAQHAQCPVLVVRRLSSIKRTFENEEEQDIDDAYSTDLQPGDRPPFTMF